MDLDRYDHYLLTKECQVLLGIANGILADGVLNAEEIRFLSAWLRRNKGVASVFPGNILAERIRMVLADGVISPDELAHLKVTLEQIAGGTMQETGEADGWTTELPVQADAVVVFPERVFCFTGEFIFGTRSACTRMTESLGGLVKNSVSPKLDYLVIGGMASRYWANTSYGRKIEKAAELQRSGAWIRVVSEVQWLAAM